MKYISFSLITLWSIYMLVYNADLTPNNNLFLWILGISSIMYSIINTIIFLAIYLTYITKEIKR